MKALKEKTYTTSRMDILPGSQGINTKSIYQAKKKKKVFQTKAETAGRNKSKILIVIVKTKFISKVRKYLFGEKGGEPQRRSAGSRSS